MPIVERDSFGDIKKADVERDAFGEAKKQRNSVVEQLFFKPATSMKLVEVGPNKVRIIGELVKAGAVSLNRRKYVAKELMKSTNTFIGKPFCVNHDTKQIIGNVETMDYDNDTLKTTILGNKQPHVDNIREYFKNPQNSKIRGLSMGAVYLHNECSRCHKKFSDEESWLKHMNEEEFIHDLPTEPHGILGTEVSLVYAPEVPGLETSMALAETADGLLRLEEIVADQALIERGVADAPLKDVPKMSLNVPKTMSQNVTALVERVEKRGNQWCVVHCHGDDVGEPIRCFDSEAEAQAFHNAMQNDTEETYRGLIKGAFDKTPAVLRAITEYLIKKADSTVVEAYTLAKSSRQLSEDLKRAEQENSQLKDQLVGLKEQLTTEQLTNGKLTETTQQLTEYKDQSDKIQKLQEQVINLENKLDKVHGVPKAKEPNIRKVSDW